MSTPNNLGQCVVASLLVTISDWVLQVNGFETLLEAELDADTKGGSLRFHNGERLAPCRYSSSS